MTIFSIKTMVFTGFVGLGCAGFDGQAVAQDAKTAPVAGPNSPASQPDAALVSQQRKSLEIIVSRWLWFGGNPEPRVYIANLLPYRCGIREMRMGFDTPVPDKVVPLPPCDAKHPSAVPADAATFLKIPDSTRAVSVELTYQDGSVSGIKTFER